MYNNNALTVNQLTGGAGGNGTGVVWSTRALDREERKEYLVPIVIRDSGRPQMTGTSTLTVIVGDINDNPMFGGRKHIFVYNYMVGNIFKNVLQDS